MSDMNETAARAEKLVDSITSAIMTTVETAAERIELAAQVTAARQRAEALSAVLEGAIASRVALEARRDAAGGTMRALLDHQVRAMQAGEIAILVRSGLSEDVAKAVFALPEPKPTHRRDGRRFARVEGEAN